ncbi:hypothetical protein DESPIGER_0112 [Desulfovibrio piger]|uniref:Uncharacterized protein n=1 Tax=Desulfovibrio piger TaxID=901 RepID=A0A1K1LF08_9BACT|nr:hypothetical protein DESPIGER_0112 [Desulfovibrio piger]
MAKRWRQYPGACGPTPEAHAGPAIRCLRRRDGRAPVRLQEGRGTDGSERRGADGTAKKGHRLPSPGTGRAHDNRKGVGQQWPTPWGSVIRGTD